MHDHSARKVTPTARVAHRTLTVQFSPNGVQVQYQRVVWLVGQTLVDLNLTCVRLQVGTYAGYPTDVIAMPYEGENFKDPFFEQMARYPVRFAHPVFLGESPHSSESANIASGTGVFVRVDTKLIGVTCEHVLAAYRERRRANTRTIFSFGRLIVDPEKHLIDADALLDLATFDLTPLSGRLDDQGRTVEPMSWPPGDISADDVIAFAGFPGLWREQPGMGGLRFYSFSAGASGVAALGPMHLYTRIEIDDVLRAGRGRLDLGPLGGLSGGPVFAWRRGLIVTAELVGFIKEYQESLDLLYIRRANCIATDGTLLR